MDIGNAEGNENVVFVIIFAFSVFPRAAIGKIKRTKSIFIFHKMMEGTERIAQSGANFHFNIVFLALVESNFYAIVKQTVRLLFAVYVKEYVRIASVNRQTRFCRLCENFCRVVHASRKICQAFLL